MSYNSNINWLDRYYNNISFDIYTKYLDYEERFD